MKLQPITNRYITPKTTGYAALVGLGLTTLSGVSKNRALRKTHKPFAIFTGIVTLAHLALIEYNHYCWRRSK